LSQVSGLRLAGPVRMRDYAGASPDQKLGPLDHAESAVSVDHFSPFSGQPRNETSDPHDHEELLTQCWQSL
jgi:hypothetical protein